jgi:hypothetical protein
MKNGPIPSDVTIIRRYGEDAAGHDPELLANHRQARTKPPP